MTSRPFSQGIADPKPSNASSNEANCQVHLDIVNLGNSNVSKEIKDTLGAITGADEKRWAPRGPNIGISSDRYNHSPSPKRI